MRVHRFRTGAIAGLAALALVVSACGSSTDDDATDTAGTSAQQSASDSDTGESDAGDTDESTETGDTDESDESESDNSDGGDVDAASATSLDDFGGMDNLVAAAEEEGELNVIALPPDWANYGEIIKNFSDKYDITVNSQNPAGSSAEEIQAAETNKDTDKAPDVFDLGAAVAVSSTDTFAPYQVQAWDDIPDGNKESTGLWVNDYSGVMSVGYNATEYGDVTSMDELLEDKFKGTFALNGNPTQAGAAFSGVVMAALANGGSADDISAGVDFFVKAKEAGTFVPLDPTPATVESGQTGVVIDWSYNQLGFANDLKEQGVEWKSFVPDNAAVGSFYNQAINKGAPHPAAARLWEEYLFSADAQNQWMAGGAQPILLDAMKEAGTVDDEAAKNLPETSSEIVNLTDDQQEAAADYLNENWSKVA